MISKDEYLKACEVVKNYHKQSDSIINRDVLKEGSILRRINGAKNGITIGKEYVITQKVKDRYSDMYNIFFKSDNGTKHQILSFRDWELVTI